MTGRTQIRSHMLGNAEVRREDLNTTQPGQAVVTRVLAGAGLSMSSGGVDAGTGDVTLSLSPVLPSVFTVAWRGSEDGVPPNVWVPVGYWSAEDDDGSGSLNGTTGVFTAPERGLYFVDCTLSNGYMGQEGAFHVALFRNGGFYRALGSSFNLTITTGGATLVFLEAGDTLQIQVSSDQYVELSPDPEFNRLTICRVDGLPVTAGAGRAQTFTGDAALTLATTMALCNPASGPVTLTLPSPVLSPGFTLTVKKTDGGPFGVTLTPSAGAVIDGESTYTLDYPYEYVQLTSDGQNWLVTGD
ncbi:hypothetical protein [Deinococcus kurensis]|uniref:hypothetical protein n=1 Tax=Deinococcus kurensis TaxID=2662757 RepID=UPI0012D32331|nr:hypothetical protein [Deinococcus kurensis]